MKDSLGNGRCDKDALGTRIKDQYENRTRYMLPRRTFTILRLDGKSFHTYTKGLKKPFDANLYADIDTAIIAMLPELQGAVFAYTQSDEISVLLTDFATPNTSAWFDGNLQKMVSVAASIMTAEFNKRRLWRESQKYEDAYHGKHHLWDYQIDSFVNAYFDCRAFTVPDRVEVMNYFRWRQQDCIRNSVSMVSQANFSHNELHGKSQSDMHEMLHQKGVNWATNFTDGEKNGRLIVKEPYLANIKDMNSFEFYSTTQEHPAIRTHWVSRGAWKFSEDNGLLLGFVPIYI